ncbi:TldD/PmbA family protein, partial [candidate division WOR-3 bacterium]|nr:TldD/PmbA family protein [candidate division WOR-3 bacterium]
MKDFAKRVIGFLKSKKVDYGDVRVVKNREETLRVKNEKTETAFSDESLGFGVRVIVNGAWGFASSS